MTLSLLHIVAIALAVAAAWFGVKWAFRKDTEIEDRRRKAIDLSSRLTKMGFKSMALLFQDYAVGDYSGMFSKMAMVVEKLRGNDKDILADLSDVFDNLLKMKLALKEGRELVRSELESVERMLSAAVPAAPAPAAPAPAAPAPAAPAPAPAPAPAAPVPAAPVPVVLVVPSLPSANLVPTPYASPGPEVLDAAAPVEPLVAI